MVLENRYSYKLNKYQSLFSQIHALYLVSVNGYQFLFYRSIATTPAPTDSWILFLFAVLAPRLALFKKRILAMRLQFTLKVTTSNLLRIFSARPKVKVLIGILYNVCIIQIPAIFYRILYLPFQQYDKNDLIILQTFPPLGHLKWLVKLLLSSKDKSQVRQFTTSQRLTTQVKHNSIISPLS